MNSLGHLHPAIVHFPIGILTIVPLLILIGLITPTHRRGVMLATAVVLMVGTIGSFVAVASGEMTMQVASFPPTHDLAKPIHEHEEAAENARTLFLVMTVIYGLLVFSPPQLKWLSTPRGMVTTQIIFLLLYSAPLYLLLRAAHLGGRLVHFWGVHVPME
jgi:uncharacterized membrane protein